MRKIFWTASAILAVTCIAIITLTNINPQSNKYAYVWQEYFRPMNLKVPSDYTGEWRVWHMSSDNPFKIWLSSISEYKNGELHGVSKNYYANGNLYFVAVHGAKSNGFYLEWYESGKIAFEESVTYYPHYGMRFHYLRDEESFFWITTGKPKPEHKTEASRGTIYHPKGTDFRDLYADEIKAFRDDLAKFKKEHDIK